MARVDAAERRIGIIYASSRDGWIGIGGVMPWRSPEDMAYFKERTWGHPVIIGQRTWESIPESFRPFRGRTTVVLSTSAEHAAQVEAAGALAATSLPRALDLADGAEGSEVVWVAGGGQVYRQALEAGLVDVALVTVLDVLVPDGDTAAPVLGPDFELVSASPTPAGFHTSPTGPDYRFEVWRRTAPAHLDREAPAA
ncbi:dihydrofolate reductase [Galactobacter caseinivorans]|uniref:dihydrofolate reductase n=1 Tax=Galactobacter caseinivorans TaxID=2676123 RepID=A0A496PLN0_9MICC|nr:dihydrofolate reductase [Galactobacter caseinivorans]RKW71442.1 dihydrofolate reductase [Galactobacter caseinivorans]